MPDKKVSKTNSAYDSSLLIKHLLQTPLTYFPDQEIIYRDRLRYSYVDLSRRVSQLANGLTRIGVRSGDTVGVMDWDSHRYLECFFAVPMMGAVLFTINVRLSLDNLVYTLNRAECDVLLVNVEFLPILHVVRDKLTTVKNIILLSDDSFNDETDLPYTSGYEALLVDEADFFEFPDLDENTPATIFFTTGTTGQPKGVSFSHRQIVLHTYGVMSVLCGFSSQVNISSDDVYMPMTPMFHVHAWGLPYLMTYLGVKQVYPGRYDPDMLLELQEKEKISFSHCVPTILHNLLNHAATEQKQFDGWKIMVGGAPLSKRLCKLSLEKGLNVFTGYGMSETCPVLTVATLKPHMRAWDLSQKIEILCRTGLPIPNVHIEVVDLDGMILPHDGKTVGEVIVRAPWLVREYYKDPQKSEELWANGWLHTGDVGYIDQEGYLQITDRLKDLIKTGGEWVSSLALEDLLGQHSGVEEAAVIGVFDEKWGERPLALVVLHEAYRERIMQEDLKEFLFTFVNQGGGSKFSIPDNFLFVDAIPKTSVGKINKNEIRKQYQLGSTCQTNLGN